MKYALSCKYPQNLLLFLVSQNNIEFHIFPATSKL